MQALRSTVDVLRDRLAPISHTSTFRQTGQITPEEFVAAGDYLVYKFPSWSWAPASTSGKTVSYLPKEKQYLVTRGVPCHRRLDAHFAGDGEERIVGEAEGDEGWLSTGGGTQARSAREQDVRALGDRGEVEQEEQEEEIPDMEDDEDDAEAIIPSGAEGGQNTSPLRTYNLYITYTPYYRTPRLYLSGYVRPSAHAASIPLAPEKMLEDIVGDYKDKTVTLEDFPFFDTPVKTASVHPCRHAAVMKVLLDRADAALQLRRERTKAAASGRKGATSLAHLADKLSLDAKPSGSTAAGAGAGAEGYAAGAKAAGSGTDEWEMLQHDDEQEAEEAIRVDQYVVVFLKFMASVTPGIEHDFTMGV